MASRLIRFLILVALYSHAISQVNQDLSIIGTPFNAMIPQDTKNKMSNKTVNRTIKFYEVIYNDSLIDVRFLRSVEPQAENLKFTIIPPDLGNYAKVSTLVGFMYESKNLIKTFVWLKVENEDGKKRFYTDYDQDKNYRNDNGLISIRNISSSVEVPILLNDQREYIKLSVQKTKRKKHILQRFKNQPVIDMGLGAGSGDLSYSFDNFGYLANFTTKNLGVTANYYIGPAIIGLRSSFQSSYFYATYETINGMTTLNVNRDKHPLNKMQLGGSFAFRVALSRTIEIQPSGTYGYTYYFDPKYYQNRYSDEFFELDKSPFYELGFRINFTVGNQRAIYLLGMKNFQEWEPKGLSGGSSFQSDLQMNRFEVGYAIGL